MDAQYYINNNPFKKAPRSSAQLKWSLGVLFLLALFAFWVMGHGAPAYEAQFDNAVTPRKQLTPLENAPETPFGGDMMVHANVSNAARSIATTVMPSSNRTRH